MPLRMPMRIRIRIRILVRMAIRGEALEVRLLRRLHGHPLGQCTVERLQALGKRRVEGREGGRQGQGTPQRGGAPRRTRRRASLGNPRTQTQGISALSLAQKKGSRQQPGGARGELLQAIPKESCRQH